MKRTLLALGLAAIASSSFAYNAQLDGGFTYIDVNNNNVDTVTLTEIQGTFYFNPVATKNTPLNEAAFLGHNSNAYLGYNYIFTESPDFQILGGTLQAEGRTHALTGGIEYFVEQFYFNAELGFDQSNVETKVNGFKVSDEDDDRTNYKALVGFMPLSNLLLAAGIDGYQGDQDDDNSFAVRAKYVVPMGQGQFLNLEADGSFGDIDDVTIGADYYFDQAFSLGAAYNIQDDGKDDVNFFSIRSKYFINSNFALGGEVGFGDDVQSFNINASYRF